MVFLSFFLFLSLLPTHKHTLLMVGYSQQHHGGSVTLPKKLSGGTCQNHLFFPSHCLKSPLYNCILSNTYGWYRYMIKPRSTPAPVEVSAYGKAKMAFWTQTKSLQSSEAICDYLPSLVQTYDPTYFQLRVRAKPLEQSTKENPSV